MFGWILLTLTVLKTSADIGRYSYAFAEWSQASHAILGLITPLLLIRGNGPLRKSQNQLLPFIRNMKPNPAKREMEVNQREAYFQQIKTMWNT